MTDSLQPGSFPSGVGKRYPAGLITREVAGSNPASAIVFAKFAKTARLTKDFDYPFGAMMRGLIVSIIQLEKSFTLEIGPFEKQFGRGLQWAQTSLPYQSRVILSVKGTWTFRNSLVNYPGGPDVAGKKGRFESFWMHPARRGL